MTPKEKAHEIIDKYVQLLPYHSKESNYKRAVASSLIAVNEIIDTIYENYYDIGNNAYEFWEQVREEMKQTKGYEQIHPSATSEEKGCIELSSWEAADKVNLNGYVYVRSADLKFCKGE